MPDDKKTVTGKLRWHLLPWKALKETVRAMEFGADKYTEGTWKHANPATRDTYSSAAMRHWYAWYEEGEALADDSGVHHLAHMMANVGILLWHDLNGTFKK